MFRLAWTIINLSLDLDMRMKKAIKLDVHFVMIILAERVLSIQLIYPLQSKLHIPLIRGGHYETKNPWCDILQIGILSDICLDGDQTSHWFSNEGTTSTVLFQEN